MADLLALLAVAAVYWIWRFWVVYQPMPEVYYQRPEGLGYWAWAAAKLLHYLCAAVWLSPMTIGPTGRHQPWLEVPGDCLLMLAIVGVLGFGYYRCCRSVRGWWLWPVWIVLAVLPVVPVLATPHSGYLCGVGFAVAMVLGPGLRRFVRPRGGWGRCVVALWFLIATTTYIPIYRSLWNGMLAAERCAVVGIAADPPPVTVSDVYLINLPFVAVYLPQCLAERGTDADRVRYHVLTYAPQLLNMASPCRLEPLDAHSFTLTVSQQPYFSGLLGRFLIEAMRYDNVLTAGQTFAADGYRVEVLERNGLGITKLRFTFDQPLASSEHCFYLGTLEHPGLRVSFDQVAAAAGDGSALADSAVVLHNVGSAGPGGEPWAQWARQREAIERIRGITAWIIRTDLYLTGPPYAGPRLMLEQPELLEGASTGLAADRPQREVQPPAN